MQNNNPKLSTLCTLTGVFILGAGDNMTVLVSETSSLWLFQAARSAMAIVLISFPALIGIGLNMVSEGVIAVRSK